MERNIANILGYGVDTFSFEEAIDYIIENHGQVVTINPEIMESGDKNFELKKIINSADLVVPDGVGVQLGLKILGYNVKRIPGITFGKELLKKASEQNKKVAMVGAKQDIILSAITNLKNEFPNLNIVYSHDGYFENDEIIINNLKSVNPDYVLVALGSPKQEFFINKLKTVLPASIMIGLGGSFDVWSGTVKRAPVIIQKLYLEWLYRSLSDPKRLKRIFPTLPLFVVKVFKERLINVIRNRNS